MNGCPFHGACGGSVVLSGDFWCAIEISYLEWRRLDGSRTSSATLCN
jgi:hypothetical protein